jgi:hypothetical protein
LRGTREAEIDTSMEDASASDSLHEAKPESVTKDPQNDPLTNDNLNDNNDPLFPDPPKRKR